MKKILNQVYDELSHLYIDENRKKIIRNAHLLPSSTNTVYKLGKYVVRIPHKDLKIFFNRRAEISNIELVATQTEMTMRPVHFNVETGLMVNRLTSPEIFYGNQYLKYDAISDILLLMNKLNTSGLHLKNTFDMNYALAYFDTFNFLNLKQSSWMKSFYTNEFLSGDKLEISHNDPDASNFTCTKQIIDFEFSGMSPRYSDISNFYSMYFHNMEVESAVRNINISNDKLEPLTIFWTLFWAMWRLSKPDELVQEEEYKSIASVKLKFGVELLSDYMNKY